jgi:hypothetical protein
MDIQHCHSILGIIMMLLAGSDIAWKSHVQITISLCMTEPEIISASDAGRLAALYLRSILAELGHTQHHATVIFEDNCTAVLITEASHPTQQTHHHIDIREFALFDAGMTVVSSLFWNPAPWHFEKCPWQHAHQKQWPKVLFARH